MLCILLVIRNVAQESSRGAVPTRLSDASNFTDRPLMRPSKPGSKCSRINNTRYPIARKHDALKLVPSKARRSSTPSRIISTFDTAIPRPLMCVFHRARMLHRNVKGDLASY
jgi:hypothetical protein